MWSTSSVSPNIYGPTAPILQSEYRLIGYIPMFHMLENQKSCPILTSGYSNSSTWLAGQFWDTSTLVPSFSASKGLFTSHCVDTRNGLIVQVLVAQNPVDFRWFIIMFPIKRLGYPPVTCSRSTSTCNSSEQKAWNYSVPDSFIGLLKMMNMLIFQITKTTIQPNQV